MIQVNFESFNDNQFFLNYFNFLIDRVFKCLPMREQCEPTLRSYIESLVHELVGNRDLIFELKGNPLFISLLGKLNFLTQNDLDIRKYKKEIFDCINLIEKIKKSLKEV